MPDPLPIYLLIMPAIPARSGRRGSFDRRKMKDIEASERRLWGSAETLRTNSYYASNEYMMPVIGLIFLRHA